MKALVIGGNPAGMSAASRMKRKAPDTEVIVLVFEKHRNLKKAESVLVLVRKLSQWIQRRKL